MTNDLPENVKENMREFAYSLIEHLILEQHPFRLVLWNNDDWDKALPEKVMSAFPVQIAIDIKDMTLKESYVDDNTGEVLINTFFNNEAFSKTLDYNEIVAVLDIEGQPLVLNNFEPHPPSIEEIRDFNITSKEELVNMIVSEGIEKEDAKRSVNAFIKNNSIIRE
jgi:hypothetical protein